MSVLRSLVRKEFLQLRRDRRMLPIVFIAPVLQLVLLGYAANLDVERVPTVVRDLDRSVASRRLTEAMFAGEVFVPADLPPGRATSPVTPSSVETILADGAASVVLAIPRGFERALTAVRNDPSAEQPTIQLVVDGTNSTEGIAAINAARAIVQSFAAGPTTGGRTGPGGRPAGATSADEVAAPSTAVGWARPAGATPTRVESRVWYNPDLESRNFMVPGILALLLMVITMLLSSLAIVKEKELGTLEQLNVTPIGPLQLIVGKLAPFVIIGFVDVALVVLTSRFVFMVPLRGSVALLFAMSTVFLATTLGLGLLISTVSDNQQQAMMTAVFFVMVPMFFLSGFAFPIESMPRVIQWVSYALPLRYYFVVIRGIFLKGVGIETLWDEGLAMLLFGAAIVTLAALRFRKRSR